MKISEQLTIIKKNIPTFRLEIKKENGVSVYNIYINDIYKNSYTTIEIAAYINGMVDAIMLKK